MPRTRPEERKQILSFARSVRRSTSGSVRFFSTAQKLSEGTLRAWSRRKLSRWHWAHLSSFSRPVPGSSQVKPLQYQFAVRAHIVRIVNPVRHDLVVLRSRKNVSSRFVTDVCLIASVTIFGVTLPADCRNCELSPLKQLAACLLS